MSADRGAYICQSQSLNIHLTDPNFGKLTSMHFYAWKKGLKTGMYYLRSTAAADAIKFTLDKSAIQEPTIATATMTVNEPITVIQSVMAETMPDGRRAQQAIQYEQNTLNTYDQNRADMACSLDNPDACEACGS